MFLVQDVGGTLSDDDTRSHRVSRRHPRQYGSTRDAKTFDPRSPLFALLKGEFLCAVQNQALTKMERRR
jgi:hypothetical protein